MFSAALRNWNGRLHEIVSLRESRARRERSVREIGGINNAISRDLETLHLWLY
jgi:hypothetical protein